MNPHATALLLATMDTKSKEAGYIRDCLTQRGISVLTMDAGIRGQSPLPVDISRETVAAAADHTLEAVQGINNEGQALAVMVRGARHLACDLYRQGKIGGVISLAGSCPPCKMS